MKVFSDDHVTADVVEETKNTLEKTIKENNNFIQESIKLNRTAIKLGIASVVFSGLTFGIITTILTLAFLYSHS